MEQPGLELAAHMEYCGNGRGLAYWPLRLNIRRQIQNSGLRVSVGRHLSLLISLKRPARSMKSRLWGCPRPRGVALCNGILYLILKLGGLTWFHARTQQHSKEQEVKKKYFALVETTFLLSCIPSKQQSNQAWRYTVQGGRGSPVGVTTPTKGPCQWMLYPSYLEENFGKKK